MIITLQMGDDRSRHGYGQYLPTATGLKPAAVYGKPFRTGSPFFPQA
jgi:hypothetical protein